MRESVKKAAEGGLPVLGECGGYLYLFGGAGGGRWTDLAHDRTVLKGKGYKKGKISLFGTLEWKRKKTACI